MKFLEYLNVKKVLLQNDGHGAINRSCVFLDIAVLRGERWKGHAFYLGNTDLATWKPQALKP